MYKYASFFSGALGLDLGLEKAGLQAIFYNEIEKQFCETIQANRPNVHLYNCDIRLLDSKKLLKKHGLKKGELFAVVGGPPCQAFSTAGKRQSLQDERGNVFLHFIDIIKKLMPKYAILENVRGLLSVPLKHRPHNQRGRGFPPLTTEELPGGALLHIIAKLKRAGYQPSFTLYNMANFGVPQIRERIIILASREGEEMPYMVATHSEKQDQNHLATWNTVRKAIWNLRKRKNLEHVSFPEKRLKYYRLLSAGQNWRSLPTALQKEALGKSFYAGGGKTGFLRRLDWNKPSPTLVTNPAMPATDLCHPTQDRPLSVEEYIKIQTFPEDYIFSGNTLEKYKQLGNAVPCTFGQVIGKHLIDFDKGKLKDHNSDGKLSRYLNTDHKSWREKFDKKHGQLSLF